MGDGVALVVVVDVGEVSEAVVVEGREVDEPKRAPEMQPVEKSSVLMAMASRSEASQMELLARARW